MKKKLALALAAIFTLSSTPAFAAETATATPNASNVIVDGGTFNFEAYTINGNNYFKLRDLAFVMMGSGSAFSVGWDGAAKCISLQKGGEYQIVGGETIVTGKLTAQSAAVSNSTILIDGAKADLKAYTIKGNTYFKLRDLGTALGFNVGWDSASKTIAIDTGEATPVTPAEPAKPEAVVLKNNEAWEPLGLSFYGTADLENSTKPLYHYIYKVSPSMKTPPMNFSVEKVTLDGKEYPVKYYGSAEEVEAALGLEPWSIVPGGMIFICVDVPSSDPLAGNYAKVFVQTRIETEDGKVYTWIIDDESAFY